MITQRAKRMLLPAIPALLFAFVLACGAEPAPVSPGTQAATVGTESTTPQQATIKESMERAGDAMAKESMDKTGDAMTKDSTDKSGDAMAKESTDKTGDTMTKESMDKTGDAMTKDSMDKTGDAMANETMDKTVDAMAKETMDKTGDAMAKETMDKTGDAMAKETMEKTGDAMAKETMDKTGDAMAKDTMEKTDDAMAKDTMEKTGDAMAKETMDKTGDAMAKETMEKTGDAMAKDSMEKSMEMVNMPIQETLMLDLTDIQPLQNGFHYEGWAIVDGGAISTGKFNVGSDGDLVSLDGSPIPQGAFATGVDLKDATAIVITIEPAGDDDTIPASTHYLSGSIADGKATLSIGHGAALGDDFSGAAGTYILATPTDGPNSNEKSGIWFLDLSTGTPTAGLNLPTLPDGWVYEGWVVIDGTPVSTGRFTQVDRADFAAPYSGPESGLPFPGEDFLVNAPQGLTFPGNIVGHVAVISVEPDPDDSPAPFALKPLVGAIPEDATDHLNYSIGTAAVFPQGTATIDSGELPKIIQAKG